ncbi:hypothetical protein C3Y89_34110 [Rhizobium sp. UPM1132]|nr:hypothetical protein [Rhizobium ruizarguesonis]NKQ76687.1 hypothetical protein [Rhizobium ruizarguesonis]
MLGVPFMCSKQCGYPATRMRRLFRCLAIALKIHAKQGDRDDEQQFAAIPVMWAEKGARSRTQPLSLI